MIKSTQVSLCLCILSCSFSSILGQLISNYGRPNGRIGRQPVLLPGQFPGNVPTIGNVGSPIGHAHSMLPPEITAHHPGEAFIDTHVDHPFTHGNRLPVPAVHTRKVVDGHHTHGTAPVAVDRHIDHPFSHGNAIPVPVIPVPVVNPHGLGGGVHDIDPIAFGPNGRRLGRRGRGRGRGRGGWRRGRGRNWRRRNGRVLKRKIAKGLRRIIGRDH